MKLFTLFTAITLIVVLSACGEKAKEIKDAVEIVKNAPEAVENMQSAQEKAQEKWDIRKKNGDTLAINFKELEQYFPNEVAGYTPGEFGGESVNMMGMSFSQATRKYTKINEDGSKSVIKAVLFDYNAVSTMFIAAAFTWMSGYSIENADGYDKSYDTGIEDCYGYESFRHKSGHAEVNLAVGYRFIIQIEADKQNNTELLKSIAKSFKLEELANL